MAWLSCGLAQAQDHAQTAPDAWRTAADAQPTISTSVPALGDFKKGLLDLGVNFQLNYLGDAFGNPTGGVRQGATYQGALEMVIDADLARIAGLTGATFRVNAYQIGGLGLSATDLFNYSTISSIEARPTTRLFELWVEQKFFDDMASIRIGQLAADNQFFNSELGTLFINNTFGWPTIDAANLPSGGAAYPLTTPGVRLKIAPNEQLALLAGIYNGDPSGAGFTGLQEIKDPAGINFRVQDPPFLIAEAQYRYNQEKDAPGLAGTMKLGAWHQFGNFNDYHFGLDGKSLADPASDGRARTHSGNFGVYGAMDQMLWRLPGDDPKKGVGAFTRISVSPSDRNLMDFYAEAGLAFMGLWSQRPDDSFGLAAVFSQLSPAVSAYDRDAAFFAGEALPVRDYELAVELTYQAQIIPGWTIQPDFQYIFHPGGGAIDPINPQVGRIPDAAVVGLRTMVRF